MITRTLTGPRSAPLPRRARRLTWLTIGAFALWGMLGPAVAPVAAFTPGENGEPTSGNLTDLKDRGGDVTFSFQNDATLTCDGDTASSFSFDLDYTISGAALPAGAHVVVYLSPNQGAINNNAGGDVAGYIADVESNETSVDMSGLSGSGTLSFDVTVTTPFQLSGGGVLGVIADDIDDESSWTTKTNSLQCSEAQPTPTPTPEVTPTPTPTGSVLPTEGPTPTPEPTPTPKPTPMPEVTPTPTPTGSVLPTVGTPRPTLTPPPTDADSPANGSGGSIPMLTLLLLAAGALGLVIATPLPRRVRR